VPSIENKAAFWEIDIIWPFANAQPRGAKFPAKTHKLPSMGLSPLHACAGLLIRALEDSTTLRVRDKAERRK
jgi:hypothetical protein